jgi:ZIP family zinc transporter
MSFLQTLILGGISGLTILLGLPIALLKLEAQKYLVFLNALAIGILFFLFFDVTGHALEPIEHALKENGGYASLIIANFVIGFGIGLLSLVYYGKRFPGKGGIPPKKLALLIAIGIGLHNFSEGLAIGNASRSGELQFALMLIIGFGLHNITEAFGIAAPLAGKKVGWLYLILLGIIGGGPITIGTLLGFTFTSDAIAVLFLSLAGGALVYVIAELLNAGRKLGFHIWNGWGLLAGFMMGVGTDLLLIALGA